MRQIKNLISLVLVSTVSASSCAASSLSSLQRTNAFFVSNNPSLRTSQPSSKNNEHHRRSSQRFAIPGVSTLTPETTSAFLQQQQQTSSSINISTILSPQAIAASASITLTYLSLLLALDRPRGRLLIPDAADSLVINQSRVPNAGLGLFLSKSYPEGTVLGTYPGVLRPAEQFYSTKCRVYPQAVGYSWRFTDSKYVLDPTDDEGNVDMYCYGGGDALSNVVFKTILSFMRVGTELTRINEPPIGAGGCNVSARENLDTREVVFTLCRDVVAGEELFLDYGLDYDRSNYAPRPVGLDWWR